MKLIKYLLPLLALPFFSSLSCGKKPKPNERPLIKLDEDFLSYVSFPKGSYWIYRETTTGETDSSYIFDRKETVEIDFPTNSPDWQHRIEKIVQHEVIRKDTFYGHAVPLFIEEGKISFIYDHVKTNHNNTMTWTIFIKYSDMSYDSTATFLINPTMIAYDSFIVNSLNYQDVIECFYQKQLNMVPYKRIYYAKGVGVVKREFWDGTSWELIRYHHQ